MKIYMKHTGGMNTAQRGFSSNMMAAPPLEQKEKSYASVGEYLDKTKPSSQVTLNSSNMVGLGLANNDKLMALNIKKKKSKNIAFEL